MHMLGSLTDEYAELLTRLAVKQEPLEMGQELHVGQPPFSLCKLGNSSERCAREQQTVAVKADLLQDNAYRVMQPANHC